MEKTIYELDLHESSTNIPWLEATRVPGGWIYRHWNGDKQEYSESGVFVPFNNEFKTTESHECKYYVNADWTKLKCECGNEIIPENLKNRIKP